MNEILIYNSVQHQLYSYLSPIFSLSNHQQQTKKPFGMAYQPHLQFGQQECCIRSTWKVHQGHLKSSKRGTNCWDREFHPQKPVRLGNLEDQRHWKALEFVDFFQGLGFLHPRFAADRLIWVFLR